MYIYIVCLCVCVCVCEPLPPSSPLTRLHIRVCVCVCVFLCIHSHHVQSQSSHICTHHCSVFIFFNILFIIDVACPLPGITVGQCSTFLQGRDQLCQNHLIVHTHVCMQPTPFRAIHSATSRACVCVCKTHLTFQSNVFIWLSHRARWSAHSHTYTYTSLQFSHKHESTTHVKSAM